MNESFFNMLEGIASQGVLARLKNNLIVAEQTRAKKSFLSRAIEVLWAYVLNKSRHERSKPKSIATPVEIRSVFKYGEYPK